MIGRHDAGVLGTLHAGLSATAVQIGDEIYVSLRDGLINPLNDILDFAIPLTQHLDHQHGDPA